MKNLVRKLWANEGGFVISVELILIVTILVIGLVSGWTMLRDAVLTELADTAQAVGAIDQSFAVGGANYGPNIASSGSFSWIDAPEGADNLATTVPATSGLTVVSGLDASTSDLEGN